VATLAKPVLAGGAVVTRLDPIRGTEVLLIHRKRYQDWTLPKGKVEPGESLPACAVREVAEETAVTDPARSAARHPPLRGRQGRAEEGGLVGRDPGSRRFPRAPDDEVDLVSWLPVSAALARLTYPHDRFLVEQHLEQPATTPLILVRHAKAMDRKDWSRKDSARPINSRGRGRRSCWSRSWPRTGSAGWSAPPPPAARRRCCRTRTARSCRSSPTRS
jgi:8-oxo-dGTP diphosphatase